MRFLLGRGWSAAKGCATVLAIAALAACQTAVPAQDAVVPQRESLTLPAHHAWGGDARCDANECRIVFVEHEGNAVTLHRIDSKRNSQLLDRVQVGYHPDSAKWLNDHLVAATVEDTQSIDVFDASHGKLRLLQQITVGFAPRDLHVVERSADSFTLVVSPYSGDDVVWLTISKDGRTLISKTSEAWCRSPRHPVLLPSGWMGAGPGVAVGCDRDFRLLFRSLDLGTPLRVPTQISRFDNVPRQVMPSPSGQWLYVTQELGGRNARINTRTGATQWIKAPRWGAVSVMPITDDFVAWGEGERVYLQQIDGSGGVTEERWLPVSGFPTQLQVIDLDRDAEPDLIVFNSAGDRVDVIFGPLWQKSNSVSKK